METTTIELAVLDWVIIGLYGMFIFGVAFWAFRKIKDPGGYLVGGRKLGKPMMIAASFAGGTNASHPMGVAAAAFQKGLAGIWLSLTWMLITPFFWLYPPLVRRLRIVTMADIVRMRFGKGMNYLFKVVVLLTGPISMGLGIKSASLVLEVMTGGAIEGFAAEAAIAIPTLGYTLLGGVVAAYATDIWQGLLIVVLSFLLIPFAITAAGGMEALDAQIADEFTTLVATASGEYGPWWIFWFAIGCMFSAVLSSVGGASAAANEFDARMGVFGSIIKRFCTVGWGLVGLLSIALFAGNAVVDATLGGDPGKVFPMASGSLLPVGLRGLMVASMLAAVMSSLDAGVLNFGGMFVNNFYQEHFVKNASAEHYLKVTRITAVVGMFLGWVVASGVKDIVQFTIIVEPLNSLTGVAILTALLWRRTTGFAAICSVLVAAPLFLAANRPDWPNFEWVDQIASYFVGQEIQVDLSRILQIDHVANWMAGLYGIDLADPANGFINAEGVLTKLPVQIAYPMYLIPTIATLIIVSLLTKQHNEHAVAEFYCRLDTPVGHEHEISEAGFEVDQLEHLDRHDPELKKEKLKDLSADRRLLLADLFRLPKLLSSGEAKLSDYKWDWIGLGAGILFVVIFLEGVKALGNLF